MKLFEVCLSLLLLLLLVELSSASNLTVKTNSTTSTEASIERVGLMSKTSDAIYRALSTVFTFEDSQPPTTQLYSSTSTIQPTPTTTTTTTARVSTRPQTTTSRSVSSTSSSAAVIEKTTTTKSSILEPEVRSNTSAINGRLVKAGELYALLAKALNSIYSLRQSPTQTSLTRPARLVPQLELDEPVESARLQLLADPGQPATRQDVHLLCRLLHSQLENSTSNLSTLSSSLSSTSLPTELPINVATSLSVDFNATSTRKPKNDNHLLFVDKSEPLNETHQSHLLSSTFGYDRRLQHNNRTVEKLALQFLEDIFNEAARSRHLNGMTGLSGEENEEHESSHQLELSYSPVGWPAASRLGEHHFHLVYWLLERRLNSSRIRVLDFRQASELLSHLHASYLNHLMHKYKLTPADRLVVHFKALQEQENQLEPQVVDDTQREEARNSPSAFQLLLDRLSISSSDQHLHLYLIIFLLILVSLILCFLMPMMCFSSSSRRKSRRASDETKSIRPDSDLQRVQKNSPDHSAIWRKLSNSTTTLVKDQSDCYTHNGAFEVPIRNQQQQQQQQQVEEEQHNKLSLEPQMYLKYKDVRESRTSDTLTKSELVMIKEKLVPIMRQTPTRQVGSQTSPIEHDYVNQAVQCQLLDNDNQDDYRSAQHARQVRRHIDSTLSRSSSSSDRAASVISSPTGQHEREPKMRHLELPDKSRVKVEAIRAELGRLQECDSSRRPAAATSGGHPNDQQQVKMMSRQSEFI